MARFYATINGSARTHASRLGTKNSGIVSHTRGWEIGCKVHIGVIPGKDNEIEDCVTIWLTSGSNANGQDKCIFSGTRADYLALIGEREVKV